MLLLLLACLGIMSALGLVEIRNPICALNRLGFFIVGRTGKDGEGRWRTNVHSGTETDATMGHSIHKKGFSMRGEELGIERIIFD